MSNLNLQYNIRSFTFLTTFILLVFMFSQFASAQDNYISGATIDPPVTSVTSVSSSVGDSGNNTLGDNNEVESTGIEHEDIGAPSATEPEDSSAQNNETDLNFTGERASSVSVKAVEIRGWDVEKKEDFLREVKLHAQVRSGQDLENFARGVLLKDENVESVETENNGVKVKYKMPAKFLGIFQTTISQEATVTFGDGEHGRVKVKFPWYRFLYRINEEVRAEKVADLIQPEIDDEVLVGFEEGEAPPSKQAETIKTMSEAMKRAHDAAKAAIQNLR